MSRCAWAGFVKLAIHAFLFCVSGVALSMQPEHPVDRAQLGRLDQARMGDRHRVQRPVELLLPECEEALEDRKVRAQIVVLPDIGLQQPGMVGAAIEDAGGGQAVAGDLPPKIFRDHEMSSIAWDKSASAFEILKPKK